MNRFLVYSIIAILLGTVTMLAPLAVLEPGDPLPEGENIVTNLEPEVQDSDRSMLDGPEEPAVPMSPDSFDSLPLEPEEADSKIILTDASSSLSSIGLMIVPSFLIALSAFIYIKKRTR